MKQTNALGYYWTDDELILLNEFECRLTCWVTFWINASLEHLNVAGLFKFVDFGHLNNIYISNQEICF